MTSSLFRQTIAVTALTMLAFFSTPLLAQLEEIVVTAQKREQNLQDVPIAVTTFDFEDLQTHRIEGPADLGKITPGVYVTENPADNNGVRINIRGIGVLDPQVGQDGRVAVYQDGVYLGKTQGLAFDMPDLQRVEILKGPQGTLYGRNTVAGAVNLISARPDPGEFSGRAKAEYGEFDHTKLSAAVNVPLGDRTAFRLSGMYLDREGWVENQGAGSDFGGVETSGFRAALGMELTDTFRFDIAADYTESDREPSFYQSFGTNPGVLGPAITPYNNGRQEDVSVSFRPETGEMETKGVSLIGTWTPSDNHELKITAAYREIDSTRFSALIPTTNPAILNAITGGFNQAIAPLPFAFGAVGQSLRPDFSAAFSGAEPEAGLFLSAPGGQETLDGHEQTSLDITYNGSLADGRLTYTGGFFYYDEETGNANNSDAPTNNANDYLFMLAQFNPAVTAPNIQNFLTNFGVPAANQGPIPASLILLQFLGNGVTDAFPLLQQVVGDGSSCGAGSVPSPANNFCIPTLSVALDAIRAGTNGDLRVDTEAMAIYGQATWHVSDTFRATLGLRYSDESKDGVHQARIPFFADTTTLTGRPIPQNFGSYDDESFDPSLTLEWDANDAVMLYASYKESYRAGGFNAAAVALPRSGQSSGVDFEFGTEEITAFEVGMKGDFSDSVRINASAYYYDFTDKQTTVSTSALVATERALVNTDDEIYGLEVDGMFALSDEWTLRASINYTDGDAGIPVNPVTGVQSNRPDELQGVPEVSYMMAIDYAGEAFGRDLFGNLTYSYSDEVLSVPESFLYLSERHLFNGNIGTRFNLRNGNTITTALWAQNLTDEDFEVESLPFETFAYPVKVYTQPRSFGLSVGIDF